MSGPEDVGVGAIEGRPPSLLPGEGRSEARGDALARIAPVVHWLLQERQNQRRTTMLLDGFCRRLIDAGLPIDRATLHMRQLNPRFAARTVLWNREAGGSAELDREHGIHNSDSYLRSPVAPIFQGSDAIERRPQDPDDPKDFPILEDLAREGITHYTIRPLPLSINGPGAASFATKRPEGFSQADLEALDAVLPALAAVAEVRELRRTTRLILDTYVGRQAGEKVLSGTIRRGQGERIHAILLLCDLRDFTPFSETRELEDVIEMLNGYFEVVARPIEARGGEILKFLGDGMLAIFPCPAENVAGCDAAQRALAAAQEAQHAMAALSRARVAQGDADIRCGIALHVGDVMYGNIGAAQRLDFTVIGPAVNLVSRIESLSRLADSGIVVSRAFAERSCLDCFRPLGRFPLKGISGEQEVLAAPAA